MSKTIRLLPLALLVSYTLTVVGQCHNKCGGHGICQQNGTCSCFPGFTGPDCSLYLCPLGSAWADLPTAIDTAHAPAECSNRGVCDRSIGYCNCQMGFWGPSCNRMSCPSTCSGHGRCLNLAQASTEFDGFHLNRTSQYSSWDADMIYGCVCDAGFSGYDCSLQPCDRGPDPRAPLGTLETISVVCQCGPACDGFFRLSSQGSTSTSISPNATKVELATAILGVQGIFLDDPTDYSTYLAVNSSSLYICGSASPIGTHVTFLQSISSVPPFTVWDYLQPGANGSKALYLESVQYIICTCGILCDGVVSFSFDGSSTAELPYFASSSQIADVLMNLSPATSFLDLTVTPTGASDQLCPLSDLPSAFKVTIAAQLGNLPALGIVSSLTNGTRGAGDAVKVETTQASTQSEYCNGVGQCDFATGFCTCPNGYGSSAIRGDCGMLSVDSSGWTGLEACPGVVDASTLMPVASNEVTIYFTEQDRPDYNLTYSGIYVSTLGSNRRPLLLANLTGLRPGALALDLSKREIYFTDGRYKAIGRQTIDVSMWANITGSYQFNTTSFLVQNLPMSPFDLALDLRFASRNAYFTMPGDNNHTQGKIYVMDLDGLNQVTPLISDLHQPMGLALDLNMNQLYFTEGYHSSTQKVFRCNLDGTYCRALLFDQHNVSVTSIALDFTLRRAFVLVRTNLTGPAYLISFDMDLNSSTTQNITAPDVLASSTFSVTMNQSAHDSLGTVRANLSTAEHLLLDTREQWVYYTDAHRNGIQRVNYSGTILQNVVTDRLYAPVGLAVDFGQGPPSSTPILDCYGHGTCSGFVGQFRCVCFDGWTDNCNVPSCPKGRAWFDVPMDTYTAHLWAECSNRGFCLGGSCICQDGFEGPACDRLSCPGWENGSPCNGQGRCLTMAEAAEYAVDAYANPIQVTYGADPTVPQTWDAQQIQQCVCDTFDYMPRAGKGWDRLPPYTGFDCARRACPMGDDPCTRQRNASQFEVQQVSCLANNGSFQLSFRGGSTPSLAWNSSRSTVRGALLSMGTIGDVELNPSTDHQICSSSSPTATNITFLSEIGKVPLLVISSNGLEGIMTVRELQACSKDALVCGNHGHCDGSHGLCECFRGFVSSNYNGSLGCASDCGHQGPR